MPKEGKLFVRVCDLSLVCPLILSDFLSSLILSSYSRSEPLKTVHEHMLLFFSNFPQTILLFLTNITQTRVNSAFVGDCFQLRINTYLVCL